MAAIRIPVGMTDWVILFGSDRQVRRTVKRVISSEEEGWGGEDPLGH